MQLEYVRASRRQIVEFGGQSGRRM